MTAAERLHAAQFSPRIVSGAVHADFLANKENAWPTEAAAAVSELLSAAESPEERRSLARCVITRHQAQCEAAAMVGNDEKKEAAEFLKAQCEAVVTRSTGGTTNKGPTIGEALIQVSEWYRTSQFRLRKLTLNATDDVNGSLLHYQLQENLKHIQHITPETQYSEVERLTILAVIIIRAILHESTHLYDHSSTEEEKTTIAVPEAALVVEALHKLWDGRDEYEDQKRRSEATQKLYEIERFFQQQDPDVFTKGPKGAATFDHPLFHRDPEPLRRVEVETPLVLCGDPTVTEALVAEPTGPCPGGHTCRGELGCGKEKPPLSDMMREILRGMGFFAVDQEDRYPQDGEEGDDETAVRKIVDKYERNLKHAIDTRANYQKEVERLTSQIAELENALAESKRNLEVEKKDEARMKALADSQAELAQAQQELAAEKNKAKALETRLQTEELRLENISKLADEKEFDIEKLKAELTGLEKSLQDANTELANSCEESNNNKAACQAAEKKLKEALDAVQHKEESVKEHQRKLKELKEKEQLNQELLRQTQAQSATASAAAEARLRKAEADSAEALRSARAEARASQHKNEVRMQAAERRISQAIVAANAAIEAGEAASARAELAKALQKTQAEARRTKAEAQETVRESKSAPRPLNMATFTSALAAKFSASQPGAYTF